LGCVGLGRYPEAENNSETKKNIQNESERTWVPRVCGSCFVPPRQTREIKSGAKLLVQLSSELKVFKEVRL
jgi:hypothetical protein